MTTQQRLRARPPRDPRRAGARPLPRLHRRRPIDHGAASPATGLDVPRKVAPVDLTTQRVPSPACLGGSSASSPSSSCSSRQPRRSMSARSPDYGPFVPRSQRPRVLLARQDHLPLRPGARRGPAIATDAEAGLDPWFAPDGRWLGSPPWSPQAASSSASYRSRVGTCRRSTSSRWGTRTGWSSHRPARTDPDGECSAHKRGGIRARAVVVTMDDGRHGPDVSTEPSPTYATFLPPTGGRILVVYIEAMTTASGRCYPTRSTRSLSSSQA